MPTWSYPLVGGVASRIRWHCRVEETMSAHPARAAKSNGEEKRRGDVQDPDYGEDVFVKVYFNEDTGEYK